MGILYIALWVEIAQGEYIFLYVNISISRFSCNSLYMLHFSYTSAFTNSEYLLQILTKPIKQLQCKSYYFL